MDVSDFVKKVLVVIVLLNFKRVCERKKSKTLYCLFSFYQILKNVFLKLLYIMLDTCILESDIGRYRLFKLEDQI